MTKEELAKDRAEIRGELAKGELSSIAAREQGLLHLLFDVEYHPALLPEGTPADVVSAWTRLYTGARNDIRLIQDWMDK